MVAGGNGGGAMAGTGTAGTPPGTLHGRHPRDAGRDAGTIHDLANVLAVIAGSAAMLAEDIADLAPDLPPDHPARENAARIALAAERAGELCERLRRPTATRASVGTLDLADLVRDGAFMLAPALGGASLRTVADGPLPVTGVALDALQVLLNLALNAAEAAGPSGRVAVRADAWVAGRTAPTLGRWVAGRRYARLRVEDSGPGLPPEGAAALFLPGQSGSGDPGRGQGLAVVAAIVEAAGGAVRVARSPLGGARIDVCWPMASAPAPDLRGRTVLIVGGAPPAIASLADAAEAAGAEVSLCLDPEDAVLSVADDVGAWDAVAVMGAARGVPAADLVERLRAADSGLPVVVPDGADVPIAALCAAIAGAEATTCAS